jgi:hypothetical protein
LSRRIVADRGWVARPGDVVRQEQELRVRVVEHVVLAGERAVDRAQLVGRRERETVLGAEN